MSAPAGGQEPNPSGQEPQQNSPQPTTPHSDPAGTGQQVIGPDGQPLDLARAARLIEDLRNDLKATKAKAKELEPAAARLKEIEDSQRTNEERLQGRVSELEQQLAGAQAAHRDALIRAAIEREASKQGAVDAEVVYTLVDRSALELDDSGAVKGADKAVKALLEAKPYLKAPERANGHGGPPATPRASGPMTQDDKVDDLYQKMRATGGVARW